MSYLYKHRLDSYSAPPALWYILPLGQGYATTIEQSNQLSTSRPCITFCVWYYKDPLIPLLGIKDISTLRKSAPKYKVFIASYINKPLVTYC
jgi:hypothetical protein